MSKDRNIGWFSGFFCCGCVRWLLARLSLALTKKRDVPLLQFYREETHLFAWLNAPHAQGKTSIFF
jgi:hypothetical protein